MSLGALARPGGGASMGPARIPPMPPFMWSVRGALQDGSSLCTGRGLHHHLPNQHGWHCGAGNAAVARWTDTSHHSQACGLSCLQFVARLSASSGLQAHIDWALQSSRHHEHEPQMEVHSEHAEMFSMLAHGELDMYRRI